MALPFRLIVALQVSDPIMIQSPFQYFGNREPHVEDFLRLLRERRKQRGRAFRCCYDLFAGSGALTFPLLLEADFAESYVINDVFAPLSAFWQQVKEAPDALMAEYEALVKTWRGLEEAPRQTFYQTLQAQFHEDKPLRPTKRAAIFAFVLNHAEQGRPLLQGKGATQILVCEMQTNPSTCEYDAPFAERVKQLHALFV